MVWISLSSNEKPYENQHIQATSNAPFTKNLTRTVRLELHWRHVHAMPSL